MHPLLLLGLLVPAQPAAPAAAPPAPALTRFDDAQWQQLEVKFPLVQQLDERGRKNWLSRKPGLAAFERELAALERARADVTKFVLSRGLDKEAADEALWLAYALAHQDGKSLPAEPFATQVVLKSLEESSGVLHIETIPAGCKVFIDGHAVPRLTNHARLIESGEHLIRVEKPGYKPVTAKVTVPAGGRHDFKSTLEAAP